MPKKVFDTNDDVTRWNKGQAIPGKQGALGILEEMKLGEMKLRGIKAPRGEGAGHNFGVSKVAKMARGESVEAPPDKEAILDLYKETLGM